MYNRIVNNLYSFITGWEYQHEPRIRLLPQTEEWLLKIAPKHFASANSPTTFETVKAQADNYHIFHVFNGGSTDTIFSDRKYQYAYRAWHDSLHMTMNWDFSKESELKVAKLQEKVALAWGIDARDAKMLRLDLEAHIEYYYAKGEHPDKQIELISDCLKYGVHAVVNNTHKTYH
jgi:hypothetical protein